MKCKSYQSSLKQNDSTELSVSSFLNIYIAKKSNMGVQLEKARKEQVHKIKKSWNFEVLVPHIITSGFYYTKIDQNNSPELLNLLFKYSFHVIHQKRAKTTWKTKTTGLHKLGVSLVGVPAPVNTAKRARNDFPEPYDYNPTVAEEKSGSLGLRKPG